MAGNGSSVMRLGEDTILELGPKDLGGEEAICVSIGLREAGIRGETVAVDEDDEGCRVIRSAPCIDCTVTLLPEVDSVVGRATVALR